MVYAPIVQVLITVQFEQSIPPMNALQIASYCQSVSDRFKIFEQGEPAGPMPYRHAQLEGREEPPVVVSTMPRIGLKSADQTRVLLFQNDRFSYGWQRVAALGSDPEYPGYEVIRNEAEREFESFVEACLRIVHSRPSIRVAEIAYTDALPDRDIDGSTRRLSSIFSFLDPEGPLRIIRGYDYSWNEELEPEGILSVRAYGPVITEGDVTAALLTTTATFEQYASDFSGVVAELNMAHDRSLSVFKSVIRESRREAY